MSGPAPDLRVFADVEALAAAVAATFADRVRRVVWARGRFAVALSGGRTPEPVYRRLAADYAVTCPWPRVHVFFADERCVRHADPASNYRFARETWLDAVRIPDGNRHPVPTERATPDEAARAYEAVLRAFFGAAPAFDLVWLGLGADGHVASLFPNAPALRVRTRWAVAVAAPVPPRDRVTLTLPAINAASEVWFVVAGAEKADAVRRALEGPRRPFACPAQAVRPREGRVLWWADRAAASALRRTPAS